MDILTYINRMNQLYGNDTQVASSQLNIPAHLQHQFEGGQLPTEEFYQYQSIPQSERPLTGAEGGRVYDTRKYLQGGRVGYQSGQLVQPGPGRQGYQGNPGGERKPLNKKQLKLLKEYKKYSTGNIDVTDAKVKSKIRLGTVDEDTIKWLKEHDQWEYSDPRTRYNTLSKKWEKKVQETVDGKKINKWISQKTNETKPQFFKRIKDYSAGQISSSSKKQSKITKKGQSYIDNWATNWLDNNIGKYGVRDFDKMEKAFAKRWQRHLKTADIPKGFLQKLSNSDGLPNLTGVGYGRGVTKTPFTYEGFRLYADEGRLSGQLRKMFYKNKIRTTPGLKKDLKTYFDFITMDKRGMYNQPGGQTIKAYKDIVNKDVIYLLSPDAEIGGAPKYQLFNSFDKDFNNSYNSYSRKVYNSSQWKESANLIEKKLGLKKNHIYNSMKKESKNLAKIFDVKQLPPELRYTLEHAQGIGAAAKSGNKEIMKRAVEDLIGTTIKQNQSLGWHGGGFEATRNALMREIVAGRNVKSNIASLNKLAREAYTDFGLKGNMYSLKGGKLSSQPISKALTETDRFGQYFKELYKTKKGKAEIIRQHGSYKNLIEKIGCSGLAAGGRASFKDGSTCYTRGMEKIQTGKITTPGERANFTKLAQTLGPDGWKFVGIDYDAAIKTKGPVASILRSVAKAAPKTTGALGAVGRFLFHPVEMGTLPLAIAGEGLYANYANKRDLKKALDQIPNSELPQYKKNLILEGYRQEARDIGGVGLETYAIDKPNVSGALEKIGLGDTKKFMDLSKGAISGIREIEAAEEAERYRKLYPEAQKEKFDVSKPMFKSGGRVYYDTYLPDPDNDDK